MRRHPIRQIATIVGLLAAVAIASCSSVLNALHTATCGNAVTVQLTVTSTTRSPAFYVATPVDAKGGDTMRKTDFDLT
jgi:hypothetical protein